MNASEISELLANRITADAPFIVGIDGCGGAGKSILANEISGELIQLGHPVALIRMDDFFIPTAEGQRAPLTAAAAFDWRRLERQVLRSARRSQPVRYQRYDWATGALAEWREFSAPVVIVEGVSSTQIELQDFYDFTIWVDCPRTTRLARGMERDGESARDRWINEWMPAEDRYILEHSPRERADLVYNPQTQA